jgi:RNA polymerase sigma-70 factor (ECF subfamily)
MSEPSNVLSATDLTDRELLARMLVRDELSWCEFHTRYDRLIYRCIHKVTGRFRSVVTNEDVREVYAMLMVNLTARDMHRLRRFQPDRGNKLSSWIGMLATNTAWDYMRSIARQPQYTELSDAENIGANTADPHDDLIRKERWSQVNDLLKNFSSKDRHFVQLYFVDGLSPEDISDQMGISVKTVYSKKHKIRCRLEQALTHAA